MQPVTGDDDDDHEDGAEPSSAEGGGADAPPQQLRPTVPKTLMRLTGEAIREFDMIHEGDRVLLGLSGGKDSLTLLHVLLALQRKAPVKFEIAAVTMDPQFPGFNPAPLIPYMQKLGVPFVAPPIKKN